VKQLTDNRQQPGVSEMAFIADVHLGKLAKHLRMLGIDTYYKNDLPLAALLHIAHSVNRIVLSRNAALSKPEQRSLRIESENPMTQLHQVIRTYELKNDFHPFSRCLVCNGTLEVREKETIAMLLEEDTRRFFNQFWQCTSCQRLYWKGSHYERMMKLWRQLETSL
jgi:uncharacterized protein with PIN domain